MSARVLTGWERDRARHLALGGDPGALHDFLCHGDGSACEGCTVDDTHMVDRLRLTEVLATTGCTVQVAS